MIFQKARKARERQTAAAMRAIGMLQLQKANVQNDPRVALTLALEALREGFAS